MISRINATIRIIAAIGISSRSLLSVFQFLRAWSWTGSNLSQEFLDVSSFLTALGFELLLITAATALGSSARLPEWLEQVSSDQGILIAAVLILTGFVTMWHFSLAQPEFMKGIFGSSRGSLVFALWESVSLTFPTFQLLLSLHRQSPGVPKKKSSVITLTEQEFNHR